MLKKPISFPALLFTLVLLTSTARAGLILPVFEANYAALDLEFDAYYSSVDFYLTPFGKRSDAPPMDENKIYGELMKTFFLPRTIILEASIYPLAIGGGLVRRYAKPVYDAVQLTSNFNLIKTFTIKYSEPWAFSLFIGNHLKYKPTKGIAAETNAGEESLSSFFPEESAKKLGIGYSGLLITFGPDLFIQNDFFPRPWIETELKLKGKVDTTTKILSWDFKLGFRYVFLRDIEPTIYISASRDRTDYNDTRFSLIKNSLASLRIDKGLGNNNYWKFTAYLGKNFPIKRTRVAFSLALGVAVNINSPYDNRLTVFEAQDVLNFLIQPGLKL